MMLRKSVGLGALAVTLGLYASGCNDPTKGQSIFQAQLAGPNEVPPRSSGGSGAAGFTLDGNTVHYSLEVNGLGGITQSHIHVAAVGVNGPVKVFLFKPTGGPTTSLNYGVLAQGSFTASDLIGISFDDLLSAMKSGNAYVNVHTTVYPGGEIRGQITQVR
jgi:hypothetical protein